MLTDQIQAVKDSIHDLTIDIRQEPNDFKRDNLETRLIWLESTVKTLELLENYMEFKRIYG